MTIHEIPTEYEQTVGALHAAVRSSAAGASGDPKRAAEIVVRAAGREHPPTHLLLGVSAVGRSLAYSRRQTEEATAWAEVVRSADFTEPYPVDLPPDVGPD